MNKLWDYDVISPFDNHAYIYIYILNDLSVRRETSIVCLFLILPHAVLMDRLLFFFFTFIWKVIKIVKWISKYLYYLYYIVILSIQQHTLYHIDQSRDYRTHRLYNVLHTVDYNLYRTILHYILLKRKTKHTCNALLSVYIIETIPSNKLQIF